MIPKLVFRTLCFGVPLAVLLVVFQRSCALPPAETHERQEAVLVAKMLNSVVVESEKLNADERGAANSLKVLLDEVSSGQVGQFQTKIDDSRDTLSTILRAREKLSGRISGLGLKTPLPQTIQLDIASAFREDEARLGSWIQQLNNLAERESLGKQADFPEVATLNRLTDLFLGISADDPARRALRTLLIEYNISVAEIQTQ